MGGSRFDEDNTGFECYQRLSILLVDPDDAYVVLMRNLLSMQAFNYAVSVAWSAAEAHRRVEQGRFDIALLGQCLPDSDSVSLIKEDPVRKPDDLKFLLKLMKCWRLRTCNY